MEFKMDFIDLRSGCRVYVNESGIPHIEASPQDIAESLHAQRRFFGHKPGALTVLEHSLFVSDLCCMLGAEMELFGLVHDMSETITGDIPGPIKKLVPGFKELEQDIYIKMSAHLGIPLPSMEQSNIIKRLDVASMRVELSIEDLQDIAWQRILASFPYVHRYQPPNNPIGEFVARFLTLRCEVKNNKERVRLQQEELNCG